MTEVPKDPKDGGEVAKALAALPQEVRDAMRKLVEETIDVTLEALTAESGMNLRPELAQRVNNLAMRLLEGYNPGLERVFGPNEEDDGEGVGDDVKDEVLPEAKGTSLFSLIPKVQQVTPVLQCGGNDPVAVFSRDRMRAGSESVPGVVLIDYKRTEHLAGVLREIGVDFGTCENCSEGESGQDCLGSCMIYVPSLRKIIFINDKYSIGTFVIYDVGPDDVDQFNGIKISELNRMRNDGKAARITWAKGGEDIPVENWRQRVKGALIAERGVPWEIGEENVVMKMDKEYFNNSSCVKYDLEMFRQKANFGSVFEINSHNMWPVRTECFNHEVIGGGGYLDRARAIYGYTGKNSFQKTIRKLMSVAGHTNRDRAYLSNASNCRADMEAFMAEYNKANPQTPINSIYDIKISTLVGFSIVCANGETASWYSYVGRVTKEFKLSRHDYRAAWEKIREIMRGERT